jgi:hypothetical protein
MKMDSKKFERDVFIFGECTPSEHLSKLVPPVGFEPTPLRILSSLPLPLGYGGKSRPGEIRTHRLRSLNAVHVPILLQDEDGPAERIRTSTG